ncbi:uncharacterized protein LOC126080688 [Elephas maximus indicus]|uniref:uncharacterized protein LOC126080688 n=1 Tax=Elephas maximus indicus TaxID=99487 RepID=UPI0021163E9C|nr:uncharacterized protein LOC126080688 [Elephas maximus indicus]
MALRRALAPGCGHSRPPRSSAGDAGAGPGSVTRRSRALRTRGINRGGDSSCRPVEGARPPRITSGVPETAPCGERSPRPPSRPDARTCHPARTSGQSGPGDWTRSPTRTRRSDPRSLKDPNPGHPIPPLKIRAQAEPPPPPRVPGGRAERAEAGLLPRPLSDPRPPQVRSRDPAPPPFLPGGPCHLAPHPAARAQPPGGTRFVLAPRPLQALGPSPQPGAEQLVPTGPAPRRRVPSPCGPGGT